jgi:hypothetical protein
MLAAFSVAAIVEMGKKIIEVTAQFQKLEAVLTNTLGSKSKAQDALALIQQFAAETNFSVLELTNGFVKLANQGFVPTKEELRKLADLANSTGKTFDQLTEAILDAQTGQFERLKEFGIKASKQGDQVVFTFKGVKTQVDYTSEAMKNYILSLGDLQGVSGSTAAISETLGGKISNLGDALDKLFNTIGTEGSGIMKGFIGLLTDFVNSLGESIAFIASPIEYARKAAKEEYEKAVSDQKEFYKNKDSFERMVEIQTIQNLVATNKKLTAEQLKMAQIKVSALALLEQEAREKELKALEAGEGSKKGLIKTLSDELKNLKQQEEDALTVIEIKAIQKRQLAVQAELDILYGKKNKQLEEQEKKEKKILEDAIADYHAMVKNQADNDAFERDAAAKKKLDQDKKEKDSLEQSEKEYHDYVKGLADDAAAQDKKRDAERRQNQIALQNFVISSLSQISAQINANVQARKNTEIAAIQATEQAELDSLDRRATAEGLSAAVVAREREKIQADAKKKENAIKKKAAQADKDLALFQIAINTAQAVIKVYPNPYLIALALATGALEASIVQSRPIPQFAKGVVDFNGKGTGTSDENHVMISKGESVITAKATSQYKEELHALNKGTFADYVYKKYITPAIVSDSLTDARSKSMAQNIASSMVMQELDTSGLTQAIKGNKKVKIENLGELASIISKSDHFSKYKF